MNSRRKEDVKRKHHRRGFTDRLYFLNLKLAWYFVVACFILTLLSGKLEITDLSIISYGIPAVFAELAVHTSFVIWKAKSENISKYGFNPDNIDVIDKGDNNYDTSGTDELHQSFYPAFSEGELQEGIFNNINTNCADNYRGQLGSQYTGQIS